jgi:protoporphyrinogen oxidase
MIDWSKLRVGPDSFTEALVRALGEKGIFTPKEVSKLLQEEDGSQPTSAQKEMHNAAFLP